MRAVRIALVLVVALLLASSVIAQEKKKKGKKGPQGPDPIKQLLQGVKLTDEQKPKVQEIRKEFEAPAAEVRKKIEDILTTDQKKKRAEAVKAAKEAGKTSPGELEVAGREAMKPTDDQKEKLAELRKDMIRAHMQMRRQLMEILTDEQKEQVKKNIEKMKEGTKKKAE